MVFPIKPTPEGGYGMEAARLGNALAEQLLKNKMQSLENQFYIPKTQSEIEYRNALTKGQNIDNEYSPERNRLANEHAAQVNKYYAPNILSEIGLRNATAANTRAEIPFIPVKYENQTRNSLTNAATLNNQLSNSFREWVRTPEGQQIVKNRPDIANAVLTQIEKQAGMITGNPIASMPQQNTNQLNAKVSQNSIPEDMSRKNLIKDIQQGAADSYEKINLPADTKKRLYAGDRFKTAVPSVLNNFEKASYYFSPKGQAELKKDEAKSAIDKRVPERLQAYRQFKQGLEFMKVSGAFLEGVPADQISRKQYGQIYDISHFFNNPTDAMDSLKYAINLALMADNTNRKSLSQLKDENSNDEYINQLMNNGGQKNKTLKDPSQMTTEEIMAELNSYGQ